MNNSFGGRNPLPPRYGPRNQGFFPRQRPNLKFEGERPPILNSFRPPEQFCGFRPSLRSPPENSSSKNFLLDPPPGNFSSNNSILDPLPAHFSSNISFPDPESQIFCDAVPPTENSSSNLEDPRYRPRVQRTQILGSAIMDRLKKSLEVSFAMAIDPQQNQVRKNENFC